MAARRRFADVAPRLLQLGYPIIPLKKGLKFPVEKGWQSHDATSADVERWAANGYADGGVGIRTGVGAVRLVGIDLDLRDASASRWAVKEIDRLTGGKAPRRVGQPPKLLLVCRAADDLQRKLSSRKYVDLLGDEQQIEILLDGQQFVAYNLHPDTGKPYQWIDGPELIDLEPSALPLLTLEHVRSLFDAFDAHAAGEGWARAADTVLDVSPAPDPMTSDLSHLTPPLGLTEHEIQQLLSRVPASRLDYNGWAKVGMALHHEYQGSADGFATWCEWSAKSPKHDDSQMAKKWASFEPQPGKRPVTMATVKAAAKRAEPPRPPGFLSAGAVRAKLKPVDWLVHGLLETDTTGVVYGEPESYKSFLALDVALHVASGTAWCGAHVEKPGPVVYIAGEGFGGFSRRLAAWEQGHGQSVDELPFYFTERPADLYSEAEAQALAAGVAELANTIGPPRLIVIDTLARNFGGGDENSTGDMNQFVKHVDELLRARFGSTVVIVHHTGHAHKERARGASALRGAADFEYLVQRHDTLERTVCLSSRKMKDAERFPDVWLEGAVHPLGPLMGRLDDDTTSLSFHHIPPPVERVDDGERYAALLSLLRSMAGPRGDVDRRAAMTRGVELGVVSGDGAFRRQLKELEDLGYLFRLSDRKTVRLSDWIEALDAEGNGGA